MSPNFFTRTSLGRRRGTTLLDVLVGIALLVTVFVSISGAFQLAIEIVISTKAKTGALALANEQMEYIRSLQYDSVGTQGGIPAGDLLQEETIELNNTSYTRRTFIQFVDDPADGEGGSDETGITADYKRAKVEMIWNVRDSERKLSLVSNIVPRGIESIEGGGTLTVNVIDALGMPVDGASVHIVNGGTSPAVDINTTSNVNGVATFPGAPASAGYEITVSGSGYSSAQTYTADVTNPNPVPGHLTVVESQTTASTFAIDRVSTKTVHTWEPVELESFEDLFDSEILIASSTNITVISGEVRLQNGTGYAPSGELYSLTVEPAYISSWEQFLWTHATGTDTSIAYHLYYEDELGGYVIVPDADLPGNSAGFSESPVDLSVLSAQTYPNLVLHALLTTEDASSTPSIQSWKLTYQHGPEPIPNVPFAMHGTKTIGTDGSGAPIYKYEQSLSTDGTGEMVIADLEWDTYDITIDNVGLDYDISESCEPQPRPIAPNVSVVTDLTLVPHTNHSLLVAVQSDSGTLLQNATIDLTRTGFSESENSSACGQAFFSGLVSSVTAGENYTLTVSASGYNPEVVDNVSVEGPTQITVTLIPS